MFPGKAYDMVNLEALRLLFTLNRTMCEIQSCFVGDKEPDQASSEENVRLEVNTPDVVVWPRTVAFYRRAGFLGGSYHLRIPLA